MNHTEKTISNMEKDILKKGERIAEINKAITHLNLEKDFLEKSITETTETIGKLKA